MSIAPQEESVEESNIYKFSVSYEQVSKILQVHELYEEANAEAMTLVMGTAGIAGKEITADIVEEALEQIVEKELRSRMPQNIADALRTYVSMGLEMHFKTYDHDSEQTIKNITDPDDEPAPIAMDTWGRANLPISKDASFRGGDTSQMTIKIPDFKENARKEMRQAMEKAKQYLNEADESKIPKPIPLNEKVDEIGPDEIEVRTKKEKQIKEQRELDKKKHIEEKEKRDQERLIIQAQKTMHGGEQTSIITYGYDGQLIISNKRTALEKLSSVVLPTKIIVKNPEVERSDDVYQKFKAKEKKDKGTVLTLKKQPRQALEDHMAKTSLISPNINDVMNLTGGVTLIQNGRTKSNSSRLELKFNQTGTIRLNKDDFRKLQDDRKRLRDRKMAEFRSQGRIKKKDGLKLADDQTNRQYEASEPIEEDLPLASQTMKVNSVHQLKALRELAAPDMTFTTFNATATSGLRKLPVVKDLRRMQDTFMQTNTDSFNMELMRGTVESNMKSKITAGLSRTGSTVPALHNRLEAKRITENKLQVLPRDRSQKVFRQYHNARDLLTPPAFGGTSGHQIYTSKTSHNFFKG